MKKFMLVAALVSGALLPGVSTGNASTFAKGDLNCSGAITSVDVSLEVLMASGGTNPFECGQSADLNCSGAVTSADIAIMLHLASGGTYAC